MHHSGSEVPSARQHRPGCCAVEGRWIARCSGGRSDRDRRRTKKCPPSV